MPPRVLLLGAAGYPNYGDELIAFATARFWRSTGALVTLNSFSPRVAQDFLDRRRSPISHTMSAWEGNDSGYESIASAIEAGRQIFIKSGAAPVNVVHLHGGGYINSMWKHSGLLIGHALGRKERDGSVLLATGLGLNPLVGDDITAVATAANQFEVFECRDASAELLRKAGATRALSGVDDAYLVAGPGRLRHPSPNLHICLAFDQSTPKYREEVMSWLQAAIEADADRFARVVLWDFCPRNRDLEIVREGLDLAAFGGRVEVRSFDNMVQRGHRISRGDLAVASRFHAHLLFSMQGASGIYIPGPDDYYQQKHGSLTDQGSAWAAFPDVRDQGTLLAGRPTPSSVWQRALQVKRRTYAHVLHFTFKGRRARLAAKARVALAGF